MDKRRFAVLSAGHFVNDIYEGSLPAIFLLSGTVGSLAGGYLSDLIGRRQVILILPFLSVLAAIALPEPGRRRGLTDTLRIRRRS